MVQVDLSFLSLQVLKLQQMFTDPWMWYPDI